MTKWEELLKLLLESSIKRNSGNLKHVAKDIGRSIRDVRNKVKTFELKEIVEFARNAKDGARGHGRPTQPKKGKYLQ